MIALIIIWIVIGAIGIVILWAIFNAIDGLRNRKVKLDFSVGMPSSKRKVKHMLELKITNEQKIPVTLKPVTATGKPAEVDNPPTWEKISGDSTVVVAEDGMSAEFVSSDTPGDSEFIVRADADLGDGVEEISDIVKLTVEGARAANLGLSAGTAVPK